MKVIAVRKIIDANLAETIHIIQSRQYKWTLNLKDKRVKVRKNMILKIVAYRLNSKSIHNLVLMTKEVYRWSS